MNRLEYANLLEDFEARFPNDAEWLGKHPKTKALWFSDTFVGLGLADCMSVSKRIMSGELDGWNAYDRDRIPGFYKKEVGRMRRERRQQSDNQKTRVREQTYRQPVSTASIWSTAKTLRDMRNGGASEQECDDYLDSVFPSDPESERRVSCLKCLDYGLVQIFDPRDMVSGVVRHKCYVRCDCVAGTKYGESWRGRSGAAIKFHRFGECDWHTPVNDPDGAKAKVPQAQTQLDW